MTSLFKLDKELEVLALRIAEAVDPETGEIPDELGDELWALQGSVKDKLLGWARWFKNEKGYAQMCSEEAKRLNARAQAHRRTMDWIKDQIGGRLDPGEKLEDGVSKIGWRKSTAVIVDDPAKVPDDYCAIVRKPQLTEIKVHLKAISGTEDWAHIEERRGVTIS